MLPAGSLYSNSLNGQLSAYKQQQNCLYLASKEGGRGDETSYSGSFENNVIKPQRKSLLIISDSMLNSIDEKRLSKRNFDVKVRTYPGIKVADVYSRLPPLLNMNPAHILLHVCTNDAP